MFVITCARANASKLIHHRPILNSKQNQNLQKKLAIYHTVAHTQRRWCEKHVFQNKRLGTNSPI